MLRWVEHEKSFITSGPESALFADDCLFECLGLMREVLMFTIYLRSLAST